MRFKRCTRTRAASAMAACLALFVVTPVARAQETKEKVTINDVDRTYLVRLPRGYDAKQKYPVVILLHGMNQDTDDMERLTRFAELADKDGIMAVYPSALHGRWNVGVRPPVQQPMMRSPGRGRRGGGGAIPAAVVEAIPAVVVDTPGAEDTRVAVSRVDRDAMKPGPSPQMTSIS